MGLIGGIIRFDRLNIELAESLERIVAAQKHRDKGTIKGEFFYGDNCAFAMVNSQNFIFCLNSPNLNLVSKSLLIDDICVFVDGIVLDVPRHREYFEEQGYSIPVASCSSIVAAAYKKWGLSFMDYLEGEFSCALWDKKEQRLLLVRDPYGHKPLHYCFDSKQFVFSSEIKGILAVGVDREINLTGLSDYLSLNCIPYPQTIFKNIYQVTPGNILIYSVKEGIQEKIFYQHSFNINHSLDEKSAISQLTDKLRDAVKKRLVGNDVYCFLSGGIDSSAIVSLAAELSNKPVNAICVSFNEKEVDELDSAKLMADHVGAKLHHVVAKPDSFHDLLDTLVFHHDSPFTDVSAYPSYYAGKLGRQLTDIVLTGDGPDQTMGGSSHHVFAVKHNLFKKRSFVGRVLCRTVSDGLGIFSRNIEPSNISRIRRRLYRNSYTPVHAAYDLRSYFPNMMKELLCDEKLLNVHFKHNPYHHPEAWFNVYPYEDDINRYLYADMRFYVTDDLMIKVDRMCMAHNLETLSPFQDVPLSRLVNSFPGYFKIKKFSDGRIITKYILKKAFEERFPKAILGKKKQGFGIPLDKWLKQDQGRYLKEILLDPLALRRGYFKKKFLTKFIDDFIKGRGDYFYAKGSSIMSLLTLELWHRRYFD